jgi:sugar lactone lactonase YvrE
LTAARQGGPLNPLSISATWSAASLDLRGPRRLAVGRSGAIYVTDMNDHVTEISPAGKVIRRWGKRGSGPGQFRFVSGDPSDPTDIASNIAVGADGDVYVSDSGNARVEVFSASGKFIRQFGSYGSGKTQFLDPAGLVVDKGGNVYVVDDRLLSMRKFSPAGKVLWTVSGAQNSDPDLRGHYHLSMIDSHGRLLLTDDDNGRVLFLDAKGHKLDAFGAKADFPGGACEVTSDSAGTLYVDGCGAQAFDGSGSRTEIFDASHARVGEWVNSPLAVSPRFGPNGEIVAIAWAHPHSPKATGGSILELRLTAKK